jgi:two-component system nitrogen regulation response regulator NtrX
MKPTLLLIDDDEAFMKDFSLLREQEFQCLQAKNPSIGKQIMQEKSPDLILLDLMLGEGVHGLDVIKELQRIDNTIPIVIFTDFASVDTAVEAIKCGAVDYLSKTASIKELRLVVEKALRQRLATEQRQTLENEIEKPFDELVGESQAIKSVKEKIHLFAMTENNVLIVGESGVGKELVARQIHRLGARKGKPFVAVNCPAIPKELVESELFGHERGSFTGAIQRRIGKFELSTDGTIFLDEIADLALDAQVKLLRVLQEKEFNRVGGTQTIRTQARVIAATNSKLEALVERKHFRQDLFYRLNVLPIEVPPLRDRKEDIPLLFNHIMTFTAKELKTPVLSLDPDAFDIVQAYHWPGNVRELQNVVARLLITRRDEKNVTKEDISSIIGLNERSNAYSGSIPETWKQMDVLRTEMMNKAGREVEKKFIEDVLQRFDGNVTKSAEHIGINRNNLHKLIRRCGIVTRR